MCIHSVYVTSAKVKHIFLEVSDAEFEPLTSAVQSGVKVSRLFTGVQKLLQISIFSLKNFRGCSLLFTWVGVKLVSTRARMELLYLLIVLGREGRSRFLGVGS
jgi:hypothetical protein